MFCGESVNVCFLFFFFFNLIQMRHIWFSFSFLSNLIPKFYLQKEKEIMKNEAKLFPS